MGETSAATAREVEETRKQMEDKVAKLSERAPEEARKLMKRVAFGVLSAIVVLLIVVAVLGLIGKNRLAAVLASGHGLRR